jgi:outer membrane protein assembly factor BamB
MQWHSHGQPPMPVDVNGDGIEDVIGFYRNLDSGDSVMHLGAFNGKDFTRMWKTRALGTLQDQPRAMLSGKIVAVTDSNNQLHVLDAATGKTRTALQLSDKAESMCASLDKPGEIWVEQVDEAHQLVDLRAGKKQAAPRPKWCAADVDLIANSECWRGEFRRQNQSLSACMSSKDFASADGFKPAYVMAGGNHRVAIGAKHPGTAIPMAAGYTVDGKKVLWSRQLAAPGQRPADGAPELADLLGSRVVFVYELKQEGARLASLDAKTGKSLWDVPIPRSDDGSEASTFRVTQSRVYLPHWTWLDIFDTKTGKHVGTIGKW